MTKKTQPPIEKLLAIMAQLRNPNGGCPWDIEQDFTTIAPYTIEEAYEVADAIQRGAMDDLRHELGDLLLQVVFHSQIAAERGLFTFDDVATAINDKMIKRHPHVFGDAAPRTTAEQLSDWETQKASERASTPTNPSTYISALDGVTVALPALSRAVKLTARAARVGFEWPDVHGILDKLDEEILELKAEMTQGTTETISDELGDVFFVLANLSRKLNLDPETVIRAANEKFERRFRAMETALTNAGTPPAQCDLATMDAAWNNVKLSEKLKNIDSR